MGDSASEEDEVTSVDSKTQKRTAEWVSQSIASQKGLDALSEKLTSVSIVQKDKELLAGAGSGIVVDKALYNPKSQPHLYPKVLIASTAANSMYARLSDCHSSVSGEIPLWVPSGNPLTRQRPDVNSPLDRHPPASKSAGNPESKQQSKPAAVRRQYLALPTHAKQIISNILQDNPSSAIPQPSNNPAIQPQPAAVTQLSGQIPTRQSLFVPPDDSNQVDQHLYGFQPQPNLSSVNPINQLTSSQYAARHAFGRDLTPFSGKPEEWPGFISQFENTSSACGFSNVENITRLQRCLRGEALAEVGYQLMLPELLPEIIETLRSRSGRPEMIINSLLQKIRSDPAPKAEKLETISFAQTVSNLCCVITASGLNDHLRNPMLIQELVSKLPAQTKLDWSLYRSNLAEVDLKVFENWLSNVSRAVSAVTFNMTTSSSGDTKPDRR